MNKLIIALLGISSIYCAAITIPSTCATPNINVSGVCQLRPSFLCKTIGADGACTACEAANNVTAAPVCTCSGTNLFGQKASTWDCQAAEDVSAITCPDGWGLTNKGTKNGRCKPCTLNTCKACDATVDDTEALGTCTACYASGGSLASGACPAADTTNDKIIPGHGWLAACPDGYVEDTVSSIKTCKVCLPGCKTCTVADIGSKCATCKEGWLLASDRCTQAVDAAGGTNACDATCADKKCATAKAKCTVCATGHEFTAADTCTKKPAVFGCKTYDDTDATLCKECDTDHTLSEDKKTCRCKTTHYIKETAYAAAQGTTAAVYFKQECAACDPVCASGKQCKAKENACEDAPAPKVECEDATLKDGGCTKCAKATEGDMKDKFVCSACHTDQTAATTGAKGCSCKAGEAAWDKTNKKCVKCAAACTTAAPSCNLGTDGKATCGAAPTTTGTDDAGSNGILISAISMILAVILA